MSEQPYKQPPITEAVIELRFATAIEADDITKVSAALKPLYPLQQPIRGIEVRLNVPPPGQQGVTAAHETHGSRLSTDRRRLSAWCTAMVREPRSTLLTSSMSMPARRGPRMYGWTG
jgi:hypothetical protein